ncbi:DUF4118 domain-containing protein [Azoarcus sp. PA01]|nr:DUF4118 domain-containing protein [Azoarcus sp. PA01]
MTDSVQNKFTPPRLRPDWQMYAMAGFAVGAVALFSSAALGHHLDPVNIVMLFPLAVLFSAARFGRGPAVFAAFLSVALFDFFFVAPHLTFAVGDLQYLLTFAVLLAVALITAELAAKLKLQRDAAQLRERHTHALCEMGGELSAALTAAQIADITARYLRDGFGARARLLLPQGDGRIAAADDTPCDAALVERARRVIADPHGPHPPAAESDGIVLVPLRGPMQVRGVMAVEAGDRRGAWSAGQLPLLETFAALIAIALERVHYIAVAQAAQVEMASERLRNSLLGALSHDLRTPLTALAGLADALPLAGPPLPAAQAELAQGIREEALRTSALVGNLLDMARLQSGKVRLQREWQPLEDVVGASLQARARQLAGHRLRLDLPADLPLVQIDAVLMDRVFCNLLENAAKYTPAGGCIEIRARALDEAIEIVVADDGPGLPPGRAQELFAKFSRGQTESARPGIGLGLAIVEAIVHAHGGTVRAENAAAGGARFVVELPRGEPPALPQADS